MWSKLDDALIDHPKIQIAGDLIGRNGQAIAIGFFATAIMWCNKHLTDGQIPDATIKTFRCVEKPKHIAGCLEKARLFDRVPGGVKVHDFQDWNISAEKVRKRRADRHAKRGNGAAP